jgi:hypothetical protein
VGNLYAVTKGQQAIRELTRALAGTLLLQPQKCLSIRRGEAAIRQPGVGCRFGAEPELAYA